MDEWSASGSQHSESEFEESGMSLGKRPAGGGGGGGSDYKNLPFDEALELSQSQASVASDAEAAAKERGSRPVANRPFDEALELSASMSDAKDTGGSAALDSRMMREAGKSMSMTEKNKPFDEAFELSDAETDEHSVDTVASEKKHKSPGPAAAAAKHSAAGSVGDPALMDPNLVPRDVPSHVPSLDPNASRGHAHGSLHGGGGIGSRESADHSSESDSEEESHGGAARTAGLYDPNDYKSLDVDTEVRDLFQYIGRYKPHEVELDSTLKCFIPEYIPAVGEMDAFLKVPPPDGARDELGLRVLDEPAASQSDSTVLELQLRAISKKQHGDVAVRSIDNAAKNPQEIDRWIKSIEDLHRSKHAVEVQYKRNMPDIELLMQEWPPEFEEALKNTKLPGPEMQMSLEDYARVLCAIMDVPVYDNLIESLHVVFSLFMEFKDNPHFAARSKANDDAMLQEGLSAEMLDDPYGHK